MFRSAELAAIAGTTVRALRHYHRLGLLPEPPRTAGGYRSYGVLDLVLLLRIRRFAALGVPLNRIGALLEAGSGGGGGQGSQADLDALDAELTARIEELTERRERLRAARAAAPRTPDLDVPRAVAGYAERLRTAGVPAPAMAFERAAAVLLAHFGGTSALDGADGALADAGFLDRSAALAHKVYELPPQPSEEEVEALAQDLAALAGPLAGSLAQRVGTGHPLAPAVLGQLVSSSLPPAQQRVMARAAELLGPGA